MYIQDGVAVMTDEFATENAHESGEHDKVRIVFVNFGDECFVVDNALGVFVLVDYGCIDVFTLGALQSPGVGAVADYCGDAGIDSTLFYRVNNSLQVGAAAGDQYDD